MLSITDHIAPVELADLKHTHRGDPLVTRLIANLEDARRQRDGTEEACKQLEEANLELRGINGKDD